MIAKLRARIERKRHPHHSTCGRCLRPWAVVEGHTTMYSDYRGCFPLCESCWSRLTPVERLPYYADLVAEWRGDGYIEDGLWEAIRFAVLAGR